MTPSSTTLAKLISLIDFTSLNSDDSIQTIQTLCAQAETALGPVAAVCLYPKFVSDAKKFLQNTNIPIATVANFPSGNESLEDCLETIEKAINDGADEIDVVLPYEQFLAGNTDYCENFLRECRKATPTKCLKVIIETGALELDLYIEEATELCIRIGADFIKTSTGKISTGATLAAAEIILRTIKTYDSNAGCKISGGVRTVEQAMEYLALAETIFGKEWIYPQHFRIGASQLVKNILDTATL